jgi:hypothetical protein
VKLFQKSHDGGADSGVTGYFLIEWKAGFSIVLLHFRAGSREAFHSHAFNALTWWLKGSVKEMFPNLSWYRWRPSFRPKLTPKHNIHKIIADRPGAWALSFRGPWDSTWKEQKNGFETTLTHGRVIVDQKAI